MLDWHGLVRRSPARRILDVVDRAVAVAATASTTPYAALHARLDGFTPAMLDRHLYVTRELVKVHAFRGSFFLVRRQSLADVLRASAPGRERVCRAYRHEHGVSEPRWRRLRDRAIEALGDQAMDARELGMAMAAGKLPPTLVRMLSVEGSLVQWTAVHTPAWESATHRWAARAAMFPEVDPDARALDEAQSELLRRYLEAYGPASVKDAAWWLDTNTRTVERILRGLDPATWVTDEDTGQELMGLSFRTPTTSRRIPPVLVPGADHVPRAYREREFFLDPDRYDQVVTRDGNFRATVWVDGTIQGRWGFAARDGKAFVIVWTFRPFPADVRRALTERARHLGAFHGGARVRTIFAALPRGWPASPKPPLPRDLRPEKG